MKRDATVEESLQRPIARLLLCGTWLASAVTAAGLLLGIYRERQGLAWTEAGIALFIILPVARVGLMAVIFLRQRDYLYASIATLVMAIVAAGFLTGMGALAPMQ
ncbi:DUF1634 domain-containing protein [Pinirhizobacter sp.]|jgi:uncharacterized membrane protein|uniref:DUF1634 domain-containing protein n=1 Tax=Pinirhizobacter sp. TaxID=2950432 RepID=UPI002F425A17